MSDLNALRGRALTIYLPDLSAGGTERLQLGLASYFLLAGMDVTFLLARERGELLREVPSRARVVVLGAERQVEALPQLVRYLRVNRPDILTTHMEHMSVMALLARRLARSSARIIVTQHSPLSEQAKRGTWQSRALPFLYRWIIPRADGMIAVSPGVAADLAGVARIPIERISVIPNGAIPSDFEMRVAAPVSHSWLGTKIPVLLAVGRMVALKDFATLLRAFAQVLVYRDARLIILGDGLQREKLEALAAELGIRTRVDMPGYVANPFPFMARASAVVLTSRYEGFGLVLAEALACGTPVVSTDCPHGPAEILAGGRYGTLVPVGDAGAVARAIVSVLDANHDRAMLAARGREFTVNACARSHLNLFQQVLSAPRNRAGPSSV